MFHSGQACTVSQSAQSESEHFLGNKLYQQKLQHGSKPMQTLEIHFSAAITTVACLMGPKVYVRLRDEYLDEELTSFFDQVHRRQLEGSGERQINVLSTL